MLLLSTFVNETEEIKTLNVFELSVVVYLFTNITSKYTRTEKLKTTYNNVDLQVSE